MLTDMKRSFSFEADRAAGLTLAGTCLVAATYGLVRLAYGLYLPDLSASLDLGSATAGYVASGASVAYCVSAGFGLLAGSRPRLLVVGAMATACVGSLAMAAAPGVAVFAPAAVLSSAGAGLASPALVAVVARTVPEGWQDRAQAVVNSGTGPGLVAAGVVALVVLPHWRLGFVVAAALAALAGGAVLLLDRGPSQGDLAARSLRRDGVPSRRARPLLVPAAAALLLGTSSAVVWTYARTRVLEAGLGAGASTAVWMAIGVGGAATVLSARRTSALAPARAWLLTTLAVAVSTAALGLGAARLPLALVAAAAFGWGFVAASSALIAWAAEALPGRAAQGTSVLFVALVLGQSLGSATAGGIAERLGLTAAFVVLAVVAALAAACAAAPRPAPQHTRVRPVASGAS